MQGEGHPEGGKSAHSQSEWKQTASAVRSSGGLLEQWLHCMHIRYMHLHWDQSNVSS